VSETLAAPKENLSLGRGGIEISAEGACESRQRFDSTHGKETLGEVHLSGACLPLEAEINRTPNRKRQNEQGGDNDGDAAYKRIKVNIQEQSTVQISQNTNSGTPKVSVAEGESGKRNTHDADDIFSMLLGGM